MLDLGWLRGERTRLQAETGMLRGVTRDSLSYHTQSTEAVHYDITATLTMVWLGGSPDSRLVPYALAAVSAHVLSSTIGIPEFDIRYNANRFGSQVGAGLRLRLGASGRQGVYLEARRVIADDVTRSIARVGALFFLSDIPSAKRRTAIHDAGP